MIKLKTYTKILNDKDGTALVIAMVFLGLLTTIGLFALLNSTTELTSSASYRGNKEAFYAAEGALEYIKGDGHYFTTKATINFPDNNHPTAAARDLAADGTDATGSVKYLNSGNPPPGYGFSAKDTMSSYFVIEATGTAASGVQNTQEEGVAKILPKG
ncbi:MAG: pilus assembly PilX N-terminal domain-containing protein [Nitrospirae bacterium]|nr:pilus assembly PilX N-terminal domain-containing protein [Nitrospirota bacterium]